MAHDYRNQFTAGWHSDVGDPCPFLLTSNNADAWILGRFAFHNGLSAPVKAKDLVKNRGYIWTLNGVAYHVSGKNVKEAGR
jgi:hypothetical protein